MYDSKTKIRSTVLGAEDLLSEDEKIARFEKALSEAFTVLRKLREEPTLTGARVGKDEFIHKSRFDHIDRKVGVS